MATKKKGILTRSPEWWVHLRPYVKRLFWKKERKNSRKDVVNRIQKDGG